MSIYGEYKPPSTGGGLYLKFEDGDNIKLRIMSEPVVYNNDFQGQISTRYAWVAWNYEEEKAQILQGGVNMFKDIANIAEEEDWGDPLKPNNPYALKIRRAGTGTDTKYMVTPTPAKSAEIPKEVQAAVDDIDLIESISASPNAHQVNWLRDVVSGKADQAPAKKDDVTIEDVDSDKPIDLSEIPFD